MKYRTLAAIAALLLCGCKTEQQAGLAEESQSAAAAAAKRICSDGTVAKGNKSCPSPPTEPPPVVASITGAASIADNFDVKAWLIPADETPRVSVEEVGAFRFTCLGGHLAKDDPIIYPGQPGASHLHQFVGNTGTNANSTYESLRTSGGSTCTRSDGQSVQRSAYWMPAMLDGAGNAVKVDWVNTYYKRLPPNHPNCLKTTDPAVTGKCIGMPNGIRFVFGWNPGTKTGGPADTNSRDQYAMGFECVDKVTGEESSRKPTFATLIATGQCKVGQWLKVFAAFPQCWDGKNLDSVDHRSHIVMPPQSICPGSHPYYIPETATFWFYTIDENFLAGRWELASDHMLPGAPAGATLHIDYFEAWSPTVKAIWESNCIDRHLSCTTGNLGNGQQVKGMQQIGPYPVGGLVPLSSF